MERKWVARVSTNHISVQLLLLNKKMLSLSDVSAAVPDSREVVCPFPSTYAA